MSNDAEFQDWLDVLRSCAAQEGMPGYIEQTGEEAWRDAFEDGLLASEAWDEEMAEFRSLS